MTTTAHAMPATIAGAVTTTVITAAASSVRAAGTTRPMSRPTTSRPPTRVNRIQVDREPHLDTYEVHLNIGDHMEMTAERTAQLLINDPRIARLVADAQAGLVGADTLAVALREKWDTGIAMAPEAADAFAEELETACDADIVCGHHTCHYPTAVGEFYCPTHL